LDILDIVEELSRQLAFIDNDCEVGQLAEAIANVCQENYDIYVLIFLADSGCKKQVVQRLTKMEQEGKLSEHSALALEIMRDI
jgi:hypothetical protein